MLSPLPSFLNNPAVGAVEALASTAASARDAADGGGPGFAELMQQQASRQGAAAPSAAGVNDDHLAALRQTDARRAEQQHATQRSEAKDDTPAARGTGPDAAPATQGDSRQREARRADDQQLARQAAQVQAQRRQDARSADRPEATTPAARDADSPATVADGQAPRPAHADAAEDNRVAARLSRRRSTEGRPAATGGARIPSPAEAVDGDAARAHGPSTAQWARQRSVGRPAALAATAEPGPGASARPVGLPKAGDDTAAQPGGPAQPMAASDANAMAVAGAAAMAAQADARADGPGVAPPSADDAGDDGLVAVAGLSPRTASGRSPGVASWPVNDPDGAQPLPAAGPTDRSVAGRTGPGVAVRDGAANAATPAGHTTARVVFPPPGTRAGRDAVTPGQDATVEGQRDAAIESAVAPVATSADAAVEPIAATLPEPARAVGSLPTGTAAATTVDIAPAARPPTRAPADANAVSGLPRPTAGRPGSAASQPAGHPALTGQAAATTAAAESNPAADAPAPDADAGPTDGSGTARVAAMAEAVTAPAGAGPATAVTGAATRAAASGTTRVGQPDTPRRPEPAGTADARPADADAALTEPPVLPAGAPGAAGPQPVEPGRGGGVAGEAADHGRAATQAPATALAAPAPGPAGERPAEGMRPAAAGLTGLPAVGSGLQPAADAAARSSALQADSGAAEPHRPDELAPAAGTFSLPGLAAPAAPASSASGPAGAVVAEARVPVALGDPGFGQALGAQVSLLVRDGVQTARLQLNPAEMGPITVQIAMDGLAARVDFQADLAGTRSAIEASLPALAGALQEAGLTLAGGGVFQQSPGRQGQGDAAPAFGQPRGPAGAQPDATASAAGTDRVLPSRRGLVDLVA